jgi:tetratricopeptide (TPR) repeat protein
MYRVILCTAAALLVAAAIQPATADDRTVCVSGTGDEAIAACTRMLSLDRKNAASYYAICGIAYHRKGKYDLAISDFDQVIRLDPKLAANAYTSRGDAYGAKRDYGRAIADFDQAIRLDPKLAAAYIDRGWIYETINDPDNGIADFCMKAFESESYCRGLYLNANGAVRQCMNERGYIFLDEDFYRS